MRAQADKHRYQTEMKKTLENTENLYIRQGEISDIAVEDGKVTGVKTTSDAFIRRRPLSFVWGHISRQGAFTARP